MKAESLLAEEARKRNEGVLYRTLITVSGAMHQGAVSWAINHLSEAISDTEQQKEYSRQRIEEGWVRYFNMCILQYNQALALIREENKA